MVKDKFKSSTGSVLALAGSAVGLGNIWRFPYMLNEYGGAAFLLVYAICVVVVVMPIMLSEFVVGRRSGENAYDAMRKLEPAGLWKYFGCLAVFIPFATLCYYCVIGGWTVSYFFRSCFLQFNAQTAPAEIEAAFGQLTSNPVKPIILDAVFLLVTALIIRFGVSSGIEKTSKVMMPLLFFTMLLIAIRSVTLPGAGEGLKYLFQPEFSKITPKVCLAAMGQAFYSLSIGMGIMITYSSYLRKNENLARTASYTVFSDFLFAVISGCAIIPALFAYGLPSEQGTGLMFKTLPVVFSRMPLGSVIGAVFFFSVLIAALSSAMSIFEVPVSWLVGRCRKSRRRACAIVFVAAVIIGSVCSLSFGELSWIKIGGKGIFDIFDYTIGNYLMPFAGLVVVLFVGWKMPVKDVHAEIFNEREASRKEEFWFKVLIFTVRFVSPTAIIAIFLSGILD